jgi:hypothetical protein
MMAANLFRIRGVESFCAASVSEPDRPGGLVLERAGF